MRLRCIVYRAIMDYHVQIYMVLRLISDNGIFRIKKKKATKIEIICEYAGTFLVNAMHVTPGSNA